MPSLYDVLGVGKQATAAEIKAAYRRLAKKYHPDQNKDDPKAKERFAEASNAYEILSDNDKKKAYDAGAIDEAGKPKYQGFEGFHPGGGRGQGGPGFESFHFDFGQGGAQRGGGGFQAEDIFADIFGQFGAGQQRPQPQQKRQSRPQQTPTQNHELDILVELKTALVGGKVDFPHPDGRTLRVKIPENSLPGKKIRIAGQGPINAYGVRGDIILTVRHSVDPILHLEGRDLVADIPISLEIAVHGGKVEVPTLDGSINLTIPKSYDGQMKLRVKGKGWLGGSGDLFVRGRIVLDEKAISSLQNSQL